MITLPAVTCAANGRRTADEIGPFPGMTTAEPGSEAGSVQSPT